MKRDQFGEKFRNLNIDQREIDRKYQAHLREQEEMQLMYEAAMRSSSSSSPSVTAGGGGSGGSGVLEITVDSVESLSTTTWCINSIAATTFTVDWGDGVIEEYQGGDCIDHTYAESGVWNVVMTFADPTLINNIDFND